MAEAHLDRAVRLHRLQATWASEGKAGAALIAVALQVPVVVAASDVEHEAGAEAWDRAYAVCRVKPWIGLAHVERKR